MADEFVVYICEKKKKQPEVWNMKTRGVGWGGVAVGCIKTCQVMTI